MSPTKVLRSAQAAPVFAAVLVALVVLLLALQWPAAAGQSTAADRKAELAALKAQIDDKRRLIAKLRGEGEDMARLLAEIERERVMTERYLRRIEDQERQLEAELAQHRNNLAGQRAQREELRAQLGRAVLSYYKEGRITSAELLVSSQTFGQVFARAHYWVRAVRRLQAGLAGIDSLGNSLREELEQVEQRRREVGGLREEREAQLRQLDRQAGERRERRAELERTVASAEEQTRELLASQAEIERLIEEAMRASQAGSGKGLAAQRGRLAWPVPGKVTSRFGTQVHPRYGTKVENKGIEIAAAEGAPIRAVASGRVVFEGWLGGYGRTIVLDHGEGFFSLYAHASETLVRRGEAVTAGQTVARVGASDSIEGPALYFEIRSQAQALDPLGWLAPAP